MSGGDDSSRRTGLLAGLAAYGLWGFFPLVFDRLHEVDAVEVLSHRVLWSFVVMGLLAVGRGKVGDLVAVCRDRRTLMPVVGAAVLISINWLVYVWAVHNGHVVDAALGYYVNPLLSVALGVVVLGEHLRKAQRAALALGALAVIVITVANGVFPWVAAVLATSFAGYGYLKKVSGVGAAASLTVETAVLAPFALVWIALAAGRGDLAIGHAGLATDVLLVSLGVITAGPLLLFAIAAKRVPLSTIGLMQYLTPTMQLIVGVVVLGEPMAPERLVGFALVWTALVVLAIDTVRAGRVAPPDRFSAAGAPAAGGAPG